MPDSSNLPTVPAASPFFDPLRAMWPDLYNQKVTVAPARNGVNRETGALIQGWEHVEQSMHVIFATGFHERVLRRWVGSFVPHILGRSFVPRVVTRFYWAIASAIDLWEPGYSIKQVFFMGAAVPQGTMSQEAIEGLIRLGNGIFRHEGVYYPRGHLGDRSPYVIPRAGPNPVTLPSI